MRLPFLHTDRRGGFTLIEVMLAIAILVFLMGGLFGTVRATVKASATMRDAQQVREGVNGLFELCQQTFPALPASATLTWINRGEGGPLPELAFRNAPKAFMVGTRDFSFGETALTTRKQANGALTLGIEYRRIDPQTSQVMPEPLWLPLMSDLQSVAWAFFDPQTATWQNQWGDPSRHPGLIRLTLVVLGDPQEWTQTFWLPKLTVTRLAMEQPAPSPSSP